MTCAYSVTVYIRLHALGFDPPPPIYNSLSTLIQRRHWTDPFKYNVYRSDIHICYSYELDTCTGADPEGRGRPKKGVGINIACLYLCYKCAWTQKLNNYMSVITGLFFFLL